LHRYVEPSVMRSPRREDTPAAGLSSVSLSLALAYLGGVCERVLHAMPDMLRNFDAVSAWPRHERNLMRPYFAAYCGNGVAEGRDGFWIPRGGSDLKFARL